MQLIDILLDSHYYEYWIKHSKLADKTKQSYTSQLKKLSKYMTDCGFYGELNFDMFYYNQSSARYSPIDTGFFDDYIDDLESKEVSDATMYNNIEAIRSFFCFLEDREQIDSNPIRYYNNPYFKPKIIDRSLGKSDSDKLLLAALSLDPFVRKLYLLILLMLTCGLRARELRMLRYSQIDFYTRTIVIDRGQKTKIGTVAMSPALTDEFDRYFNHSVWAEWSGGCDKEVFFHKDSPLSYDTIRNLLNAISVKAGLKKCITPHQLRYTMARLMLDNGIDISLIQRQMRHKRIETTLRYLPVALRLKLFDDF